jgi:hypothetical protein
LSVAGSYSSTMSVALDTMLATFAAVRRPPITYSLPPTAPPAG